METPQPEPGNERDPQPGRHKPLSGHIVLTLDHKTGPEPGQSTSIELSVKTRPRPLTPDPRLIGELGQFKSALAGQPVPLGQHGTVGIIKQTLQPHAFRPA